MVKAYAAESNWSEKPCRGHAIFFRRWTLYRAMISNLMLILTTPKICKGIYQNFRKKNQKLLHIDPYPENSKTDVTHCVF